MSLEQVLLIAFLVVLPLIQYVMELVRKRNKLLEQVGLPPSARRPPMREQELALSQNARPAASGVEYTNTRVGPAADRSAQRSAAVTVVGNPFDPRRAIVLLTLIGPCRAVSPHGWPDNGGH